MSRVFEFLQKLSSENEAPKGAVDGATVEDGRSSELKRALAVLLPERGPGATIEDRGSSLQKIPIVEVEITPASRVVTYTDPTGPVADRFRLLRMRLKELRNLGKLKTFVITSPQPQDGKSTIALNLATALAERGKRTVLLIDADLHRSALSSQLGLGRTPGLTDCLKDGLDPLSAVRRIEPLGIYCLSTGCESENPTEMLQGEAFSEVMQTLSFYFDWILVDAPPVLALTDAMCLQQRTDGTLLVVRAGKTSAKAVEDSIARLGRKSVLGVVLNGVEGLPRVYSEYYRNPPTNPKNGN